MDFLTDDDFINYVLGVTPQSASQWETYFMEHPEQIADTPVCSLLRSDNNRLPLLLEAIFLFLPFGTIILFSVSEYAEANHRECSSCR